MADEWDVIHVYTRAQALEDGLLVDVSERARELGFKFPVALTRTVWEDCVAVPEGAVGQDESGRLQDVLWMLLVEIRRAKSKDRLEYELVVVKGRGRTEQVKLLAVCGPGDDPAPVVTVMFPGEE